MSDNTRAIADAERKIIRAACAMMKQRVVNGSGYYHAVRAALRNNTRTPEGNMLYHVTRPNREHKHTMYLIHTWGQSAAAFSDAWAWATGHVFSQLDMGNLVVVLWSGEPHISSRERDAQLRRARELLRGRG
jgi:hypothetical protein